MDLKRESESLSPSLSTLQISNARCINDNPPLDYQSEAEILNTGAQREVDYDDDSIYMAEQIEKEVHHMNAIMRKKINTLPLDPSILPKLETEAKHIATSVDGLTENLTGLLHNISALTLDCLDTYGNAIGKTCDAVDSNIKLMYQLMAKCEELNKIIDPLYELHRNVKDIKHVLDQLENAFTFAGSCMMTTNENIDLSSDQIKTFKDFLMSYNKLSEICFDACAWDFTLREVKKQEEKCALNCMEKYLKMNQRMSQRFQEYQMIANENAIAASKRLSL